MSNKFMSVMNAIGHDAKIVWSVVVKYLPLAEDLAMMIFPASKTLPGFINSVGLIQQAVATVEQKFSLAGAPTGSGAEKLAQVLSIVTPTVTQLLTAEGLHVDSAYIQNIVNAVVAILNVRLSTVAAA